MKNSFLLILLFFLTTNFSYCQESNNPYFSKIDNLRKLQLNNLQKRLDTSKNEDKLLFWQYSFLSNFNSSKLEFNSIINFNPKKNESYFSKVYSNINLGDYYFYKFLDKDYIAFKHYKKALDESIKSNDKTLICEAQKKILNYYENIIHVDDDNYKTYLDSYKKYAYDSIEKNIYNYYNLVLNFKNKSQNIEYFNLDKAEEILTFFNQNNLSFYQGKTARQLGIYYDLNNSYTNSLKYYNEAIKCFSSIKHKFSEERKMISLINKATLFISNNKNSEAEELLLNASYKRINKLYNKNYWYLYYWLSINYKSKNNYKKSLDFLTKSNYVLDSLNQYKHTLQIAELETKYQTEKKEKEIAQQKIKERKILYSLYGSVAVFLLGAIIALLILKNSRKQRQLALQQKELEKQKNISLLKDQEILAINAMVEGQEKERKRIAEDLHDNIGSVLATLKLHFENLKLNREKKQFNQEELYEKTEKLIDETYLKVRTIAHEKNAGVIANQGLLLAVKIMAEKISSANKIKIDVIDFGLDKPLENTLEIAAFRIIQELTTNIIKHAEATNATINISQFNGDLNIIIEDNGKGFSIDTVEFKNGMGLSSIKTRVEHLNGTFEVDSTLGKGTSIIINIPTQNT